MTTLEGVAQEVVVGDGETGGAEPVDVVAGVASLRDVGDLPEVRVGVAVPTGRAPRPAHREVRAVAALARDRPMPSAKGKPGQGMVETGGPRRRPRLLVVARGAGAAEAARVRIVVAIGTRGPAEGSEPQGSRKRRRDLSGVRRDQGWVARGARGAGMRSLQREHRLVVEEGRWREAALAVAGLARGIGELAAVWVVVARRAGDPEPQERAGEVLFRRQERSRVRDVVGAMAAPARQGRVPPLQRPARLPVVEGFDAVLSPPHELEVSALVLDVARSACLGGPAGVEPLVGGDPLGEEDVAVEAAIGGDPLTGRVTLEAGPASLKMGMGVREIPW